MMVTDSCAKALRWSARPKRFALLLPPSDGEAQSHPPPQQAWEACGAWRSQCSRWRRRAIPTAQRCTARIAPSSRCFPASRSWAASARAPAHPDSAPRRRAGKSAASSPAFGRRGFQRVPVSWIAARRLPAHRADAAAVGAQGRFRWLGAPAPQFAAAVQRLAAFLRSISCRFSAFRGMLSPIQGYCI